MIWTLLSVCIIIVDQLSKWYVSTHFELGQTVPLIQDVFHLTYWRNPGAAFSIFPDQRILLIIFSFLVIGFILWYLVKNKIKNKLFLLSVSFIIGGAVGNLIDRILFGEVVDFFDFTLINFAIFNVADCFVVIGTILLVIYLLKSSNKKDAGHENE